jgi:hypothetical protein
MLINAKYSFRQNKISVRGKSNFPERKLIEMGDIAHLEQPFLIILCMLFINFENGVIFIRNLKCSMRKKFESQCKV